MFSPIGITAREGGAPESPDAGTTTINLPVYLLPNKLQTHSPRPQPRCPPPSSTTSQGSLSHQQPTQSATCPIAAKQRPQMSLAYSTPPTYPPLHPPPQTLYMPTQTAISTTPTIATFL